MCLVEAVAKINFRLSAKNEITYSPVLFEMQAAFRGASVIGKMRRIVLAASATAAAVTPEIVITATGRVMGIINPCMCDVVTKADTNVGT